MGPFKLSNTLDLDEHSFLFGDGYCTHAHALAFRHAQPKYRKIWYCSFRSGAWEVWRAREKRPLRRVRFARFMGKGPSDARPTTPHLEASSPLTLFCFSLSSTQKQRGFTRRPLPSSTSQAIQKKARQIHQKKQQVRY
jgi:hypothetical protein